MNVLKQSEHNMKKLFIALLSVGFLASCTDVLEDVEPSTSISFEAALTSPEAVDAIRASMYSKMRGSFDFTTEYFIGPAALADLTSNRPGSSRFQALNVAVGTSGTTHIGSFGGYEVIQEANLLINGIADGVLDQATLDRYRGEAHAIRAFVNHRMATTYGYEPGTSAASAWDLSIILRQEATLDLAQAEPLPRSTVSEVYAAIKSDIAEAKSLLSGVNADNGYVTEAFVEGIAARVHLYAGEYSQAATAAEAAISKSGRALVATEAGVASMFRGKNPEALFELVVDPNTEPIAGSNTNSGPVAYTSDQWVAQVPTNELVYKYGAGDWRVAGWHGDCISEQSVGATANGCETVNDLGVSITKFNGWRGNLAQDLTYMRVAEMYLILAEASAKASNNPTAGIPYLEELRAARGAGAVPAEATANMTAFEDFILDERARELSIEGHRFFDLKRLERDIPNSDGGIKMRKDSYRLLSPFGIGAQNVNPLLVENPGYDVAD